MVGDEADRWVGYGPLLKNAIWFVATLNPSRGYEGLQVTSRSSLTTERNSQMLCTPIRLGGDLLTGLLFGLDSVFELHTVQELGDLLGTA